MLRHALDTCSGVAQRCLARVSSAIPAAVIAVVIALVTTQSAEAQQSAIQGLVTSANTGTPLQGVSVVLEAEGGPRYAVVTDRNGFFQIGGITPGTYILRAQLIGYAEHTAEVTLPAGERVTLSFTLEQSPLALEGVIVSAERAGGGVVRTLGGQRVTPRDLRRVPVPAGSGDLAGYLQTLPGVVATGDRGGHLFVRGGTAAENLILVDGIPIFQPFHIVGSFSVFPEDLISGVDFYAGGFGARYTGRTSSVLDVQIREGDPNGFRTTASAGPFVTELLAEGGLGRGVTWLFSGRRSLVNETSEALLGERQPVTFDSQLLKFSSRDLGDTRCSALLIRTDDRGQIDPEDAASHVSWRNTLFGGRCVALFESALKLVEVNFSVSKLENEAVSRGSAHLASRLRRFQHDAHTTNMIGTIPVKAGYQMALELTDSDLRELYANNSGAIDIFMMSAYAEAEVSAGDRLELRPGAVFSIKPSTGIDPRLRASFSPFGRDTERIEAAFGLYRQDLVGTSDMRDVSSVFMAWTDSPDDVPMRSMHAVLGWHQSHGTAVDWAIEGYYKRIEDVPVPKWSAVPQFQTDLSRADGTVYGVDARVALNLPRFYGFVGYGFSWIEYEASQREFGTWFGDPIQRFHPPHDRRHQVNAVGSLDIAGFAIAARWQLGSGLPFTRPLGFDEAFDYSDTLRNVSGGLGTTRMVVDRPYTARLPVMHRLDLSVRRGFDLSFGRLELQAGAINAYNRRNVFYYDLYSARRVDQLPLAPYASVTFRTGTR